MASRYETSTIKQPLASLLSFSSIAALSVFYGMNENAIVFLGCVFGLLCAATLTGSRRIAGDLANYPLPSIVAVLAIVLLGFNYQFSLSKDSSFAAALGLALLPLTF
ncbi:MAG: hypothetical protein ACE1ZA_22605, partial [Pseudomonadales bacterium]